MLVSPSLLSADFNNLGRDVEMLNQSQADWLHCDVMDGVFVPNISFGLPILSAVKKISKKPLDVHLMMVQPERYIDAFKKAGADYLTVHIEACIHLDRTLNQIKEAGMKAGVAINPGTSVKGLRDVLQLCDLVLVMSVNPGFGGQKFIPNSLKKVQELVKMRKESQTQFLIEVDGGVDDSSAPQLLEAGADCLVAGNYVFSASHPADRISYLKFI